MRLFAYERSGRLVPCSCGIESRSGKGFASVSHHAQAVLYSLLLSDRYDTNISESLLIYIASAHRTAGQGVNLLQHGNTSAEAEESFGKIEHPKILKPKTHLS